MLEKKKKKKKKRRKKLSEKGERMRNNVANFENMTTKIIIIKEKIKRDKRKNDD
jgi:hypothetical protein